MRSIEANGKSVDEAIFKGLSELGTSIDEVEIQIIQQESKGVFGIGAKPAIVKLTEREPEEILLPDYMKEPSERPLRRPDREPRRERTFEQRPPRTERSEAPAERAQEQAPREMRPRQERAQGGRPQGQPRADRDRNRDARPQERMPERPKVDYSEEAAEGNRAADFLKGVISRMGVEAKVLAAQDEDGLKLYIDSETMGMLIGHRGETLDALQYLSSLCLNRNRKEEGYLRVNIDTEGYREKREQTLTRLARRLASQVKATGKPRSLEPMNPYERRVLHATLQNHPYVSTHSEGEEPNRRVIITPKQR